MHGVQGTASMALIAGAWLFISCDETGYAKVSTVTARQLQIMEDTSKKVLTCIQAGAGVTALGLALAWAAPTAQTGQH